METGRPPARIVLTIQQEVAERIIAEPGDMSLLALSVQAYGRPRMMGRIPALAFYPAPKVDSAVLRIDIHSRAIGSPEVVDALFVLARAGFQQRRKQLHNALSGSLSLSSDQAKALLGEAGIDPTRRAQSLKLDEWLELSECWLELPAG